ncbi:poly(A) RNA polymerase, mitochondrial isoform X2 [Aethina tumida]|nr:poly(A) RNA polymerase, mitochondrial isoform X2 [Aethina tumida]
MIALHNHTKLNDIGSRLRYLTVKQIEAAMSGLFPNAVAMPFGSSVNGCGKMGCDLDLVLRLDDTKEKDDSRLIFHCKTSAGSERSTSQRHMEAIGDIIHLFLPGCSQVRRILQARVPIIKYHQHLTDVECDLSMTNLSGVHMSDFLYIMGSIDSRVRPLIFAVRKWAAEVGLTNVSPGRWISNFSLTLLVLAFLQRPLNSESILPSLNTLVKLAGPNDKYVTEDGINCSFLRDINLLNHKTKNQQSLGSLLAEFFEFYSQFDFSAKAICLNEPIALTKPEHSALYIVNPLERGLNVSKNVSLEELEKFKMEVRNAAWVLESQENKSKNWGLLSIFERRNKPSQNLQFTFTNKQSRLMNISTLFEEEESYKNETVKAQVESIKQETQDKIKQLETSIKRQKSQR